MFDRWRRAPRSRPRPWESRGAALAELTLDRSWRHRRIDSIRFDVGDQGRWSTSIDCTVPADPRLAYGNGELMLVPLARLRKGALRAFDTRDASGQPLSVLGLDDGVEVSLELLRFLIEHDEIEFTDTLAAALRVIIGETLVDSERLFNFLGTGVFEFPSGGTTTAVQVIDPQAVVRLSDVTQGLIITLSEEFYLYVLIPSVTGGVRQVLKFSRHWQHRPRVTVWGLALTGLGFKSGKVHIPTSPSDAESYHLQVHLTEGLRAERLELLGPRGTMTEDFAGRETAHVRCAWPADYLAGTPFGADLVLGLPGRGLPRQAMVLSVATALFFIASFWFDGAIETMRASRDSAALLLAVPAALAVFTLGGAETLLKTQMLAAPRFVIGVCSVVLTLAATSLTWGLTDPYFVKVWTAGLVVSVVCATLSTLGAVARRRRWRRILTLSSLQRGKEG